MVGDVVLAQTIDPSSASGLVQMALQAFSLAPGSSSTLNITLDLKPECPNGALEMIIGSNALIARDAITALPVEVLAAGSATFPFSSRLATIVAPADKLLVRAESLMPPLLVPSEENYPVMSVQLTNPAGPGSGGVQINAIILRQDAGKASNPALGAMVTEAYLVRDELIIATLTEVNPTATSMTLVPTEPLIIEASASTTLDVEIGLASGAPPGSLILSLEQDGVVAGPPGGEGVTIQVLPQYGTTFPFITEPGNTGGATLTASYANFPNPFAAGRESTTFAFSLQKDARVSLRLLTPHGELVATILKNEPRPAGFFQTDVWTGHNGNGTAVHNGVYLAEIVAEYSDGTRERVLRKVAVVR